MLLLLGAAVFLTNAFKHTSESDLLPDEQSYWMVLYRKSEREFLYYGVPGKEEKSTLLKEFQVKTGIPRMRPTPLPELVGRDYFLITDKFETPDDLDTAPYFLKLDIPYSDEYPYGPESYLECNGQCDWILPGSFGLHGVNGDNLRLDASDPGSSGCVRHRDEDITLLYKILDTENENYRYYIKNI